MGHAVLRLVLSYLTISLLSLLWLVSLVLYSAGEVSGKERPRREAASIQLGEQKA